MGQTTVSIEKEAFLEKVRVQNARVKKSLQEIQKAKAEYLQTAAVFLPNVTASHTGFVTTNPLMAFGSRLNQGILTQNDFNPAILNNPAETRNFATVIQVQQPLINVDAMYQRKAAKDKVEISQLQSARIQDYILLESQRAYMDLQIAYKNKEVVEKAVTYLAVLAKQSENFYEQGILQKSDALSVKIRLLELQNKLEKARSYIQNTSHYLSHLMNEDASQLLQPQDSLIAFDLNQVFNQKVSVNRADLKALELANRAQKNLLQSNKFKFLPKLNAFGSYELYDNQIFNGDASGYVIGATLSWNVFDGWKRKGAIKKSEAQFEQAQINREEYTSESNLELAKTLRQFAVAKNNIQLSKLALEQSEEVLRIKTNRFKAGLEKTSEVLLSESQVSEKRLAYYQAIYEYNYTFHYLEFLTKQH
jgi:outer membrane protein TolC